MSSSSSSIVGGGSNDVGGESSRELELELELELGMKKRGGGRSRLVLFPSPFQGHINPMLQLATLLHSRGFSITIIHTPFNTPIPSNYPTTSHELQADDDHLFTFEPISDGLSSHERQASTQDMIAYLKALNLKCVVPFRDCLARLLTQQPEDDNDEEEEEEEEEEPIDPIPIPINNNNYYYNNNNNYYNNNNRISCIISDATMHFTKAVAESFKLPWIVLRTSSVISFLTFAAVPLFLKKGYFPIQDSQLEAAVPEFPPLKVKDLPMINTNNMESLYELLTSMVNNVKSSLGVIWNSFEPFEKEALDTIRRDFQIPVFPIGPFHKRSSASSSSLLTQDLSCISWLDRQAPSSVIYVSFGSLAAMDESEFVETAWGLSNSDQPFLWVIRPGLVRWCTSTTKDNLEKCLPHGFIERSINTGKGCIVKWAPQQQVLGHPSVGGFWTHNGWNSTMESICEGVPMLCRPCFGDQMVNARYVSEVWKVGLQLEGRCLERGEIEREIRKLMVKGSKEREEIMLRVKDLREQADACLKKGGSSFHSLESLTDLIHSL